MGQLIFKKMKLKKRTLLIKAFLFREANDGNKFDRELLNEANTFTEQVETTLNLASSFSSNLNSSINSIYSARATNDTVNGIDNRQQFNDFFHDVSNISELNKTISLSNYRNICDSIDDQLANYKIDIHNRYMQTKPKPLCNIVNENISNHTGTHRNINDAWI